MMDLVISSAHVMQLVQHHLDSVSYFAAMHSDVFGVAFDCMCGVVRFVTCRTLVPSASRTVAERVTTAKRQGRRRLKQTVEMTTCIHTRTK